MSTIEQPSTGEGEILKKYPESRFIEAAYKDIQKATLSELETLKKKYENWVKHHEESVTENRTTMFSDLLSEVEARRKALPAPETRTKKVERLKRAIEGQNGRSASVDVRKILKEYREKSKDVKTPIAIDLAPDIRDDPFWNGLEAYMFKFALQDGKYFLCVQEKGEPKAICVVEFNQEEYDKRISKEVPVKDRVGKTYGIGDEIRIGI